LQNRFELLKNLSKEFWMASLEAFSRKMCLVSLTWDSVRRASKFVTILVTCDSLNLASSYETVYLTGFPSPQT